MKLEHPPPLARENFRTPHDVRLFDQVRILQKQIYMYYA